MAGKLDREVTSSTEPADSSSYVAEKDAVRQKALRFDYRIECRVVEAVDCTVFKVGDRFTISGPNLVFDESDKVCVYALQSVMPFLWALQRKEIDPIMIGLCRASDPQACLVHCCDPGPPFTTGGRVVIDMRRVPEEPEITENYWKE